MKLLRLSALTAAGLLMTAPTWAQDTPPPPVESRPAIASYWGDTGLWFLPTAEVLRPAGWSFTVYRTELDFNQGFTDLWPCSPTNVAACTPAHGQGAVSNEHAVFDVPAGCAAGCDYFVVVRGYDGSQNSYGVTIKVQ